MNFIGKVIHHKTLPKLDIKADKNKNEQIPSADALDQTNLSQEEIKQASQQLNELKDMLAGGKEVKDSLKTLVEKHRSGALSILTLLLPFQAGSMLAEKINQQEMMETINRLDAKLKEKNLPNLKDKTPSEISELLSKKYNGEEAVSKLKRLGDYQRLYKPTPIRGALREAGHYTGEVMKYLGPIVGSIALAGLLRLNMLDAAKLVLTGSLLTFGITTMTMMVRDSIDIIKPPKKKHYEEPINIPQTLKRLEHKKTVKIKQDDDTFTKINDLTDLNEA